VHPFEADEPSGHTQWHEWAEEHAATHKHTRCPKCGLYVVCAPLEAVAGASSLGAVAGSAIHGARP
jgi:hypothetical protein